MPDRSNDNALAYLGLLDGQEIPEGYAHYIWMSDRCLEGTAWCEERGLDYDVVPSHNSTAEEIEKDYNYYNEVRLAVLKYATDILNKYHHTAYSLEQWRIMLNTWMERYVEEYHDKYRRLQDAERLNRRCECDLYCTDAIIPVLDFYDYGMLTCTDAYHVYQYSKLYEVMKPFHSIEVRHYERYERPPIKKSGANRRSWKFRAYREAVKALDSLGDTAVVLQDSYLSERFLFKLMLKHPGKIVNYNAICNYAGEERDKLPITLDTAWRNTPETLPEGLDEFTTLMCAMLKKDLPIAYVEGFSYLQQRAKVLYRHATHPKAILFVSGASSGMETFKAYLMEQKGTDALLCGIQHGGGFGYYNDSLDACLYEPCDVYYTWGWSREKKSPCSFKPMPAVKLIGIDNATEYDGEDILYVSYCDPKSSSGVAVAVNRNELQGEKTFLCSLSSEIRKRIRYRAYPVDGGWGFYSDIKNSVPDLRFDYVPHYYASLASSRLIIASSFRTTTLEALGRNKPVVTIYPKRLPTAPEAVPDIEAMHCAGLLYYDFQELLGALDEILPDIDAWWNKPERQQVVKRIQDKYVFLPPNAEKTWEKELIRLSEL